MAVKRPALTHLLGAAGVLVVCLSVTAGVVAWGSARLAPRVTLPPLQAAALTIPRRQVIPVKPAPPPPPAPEPSTPPPPAGPDCAALQCVALTFDDGPSTQYQAILDTLASRQVKATFFVQGWRAAVNPGAIAAIAAAGHVVGNHAYNHPHFQGQSVEFIDHQLQLTNDTIVAAGAPVPTVMRPPYGENPATLGPADANLGMVGILWDVDPADWSNPGPDKIIANIVTNTKRGSIVLMHDMWPGTVEALPTIIDNLRAMGFTLVTVPELIGDQAPGTVLSHGAR